MADTKTRLSTGKFSKSDLVKKSKENMTTITTCVKKPTCTIKFQTTSQYMKI